MKILHLPLKAKWYEMIESGVKRMAYVRPINRVYEQELLEYVICVTPTSSSPTATQSEQ